MLYARNNPNLELFNYSLRLHKVLVSIERARVRHELSIFNIPLH
jgi:hypothetical protein